MEKAKIGYCQCCGYEDLPVSSFRDEKAGPNTDKQIELCEVCAGSLIGVAYMYDYPDRNLYVSLAWCTNRILEEIRKPK